MKRLFLLFAVVCTAFIPIFSQETFPVNGVHDQKPECYALTNAVIIVNAEKTIAKGTLVFRKGVIESVGENVAIPKDAVVIDLKGKYIYPAFIDVDSDYGLPEVKQEPFNWDAGPQMESKTKGAYNWNQAIKPEMTAFTAFSADSRKADELRRLGFGAVLTHRHDGIARGSSAFVALADGKENLLVLRDEAAAHYSFNKGSSTQDYPSALMGSIALLRQTYEDANWYARQLSPEYNISLKAWNRLQSLPQIFEVNDKLSALRADKIGDEFGVQYIIRGSGDEYQRIADIKKTGASFILPLTFPLPFNVEDPFDAQNISLGDMRHWELAPTNPSAFEKNNIPFAFTLSGLKNKSEFWENIRTAIRFGLSKKAALSALTDIPATLVKMDTKIGTLDKGKYANLIVTSGDIFEKETLMYQTWTMGKPYDLLDLDLTDIRGNYTLSIQGFPTLTLSVVGTPTAPTAQVWQDTAKKKSVTIQRSKNMVSLTFQLDSAKNEVRLSGWNSGGKWEGKGQNESGNWTSWTATLTEAMKAEAKKADSTTEVLELGALSYPLTEYGWQDAPKAEKVLLKNATVWTNEKDGIIKNTDVLLDGGKISVIGNNLSAAGAKIVDATGKHLTAGIIDEHSHIAISGDVNEGTQAVTSEVRIGDVVDCDDVNIYRQLAGGVTSSHLLHGSANPIGGQSVLIKLRWGASPEAMKFGNNDPFIKFALGENVKQSNWGDKNVVRFPQTRMGVEQVYLDAFTRAREYEKEWDSYYKSNPKGKLGNDAPRRDIELDALVEILNSKRFITCHSYVQSEINMLMKIAEKFGFRVNTFTHILEGYKVADIMKKHGAGGSSFSDWWAYKYEVIEAIPYNGALLHDAGVTTAFNSDSPEMARRLNQEAAKAVKYGGISEEEALKFVTLNPAKLLHVDNRVGSIKVGKDADVVLWSDNPLSIYARVEKTFVDGKEMFDLEKDKQLQEEITKERARLVQKMLDAKKKGMKTAPPVRKAKKSYQCSEHDVH